MHIINEIVVNFEVPHPCARADQQDYAPLGSRCLAVVERSDVGPDLKWVCTRAPHKPDVPHIALTLGLDLCAKWYSIPVVDEDMDLD